MRRFAKQLCLLVALVCCAGLNGLANCSCHYDAVPVDTPVLVGRSIEFTRVWAIVITWTTEANGRRQIASQAFDLSKGSEQDLGKYCAGGFDRIVFRVETLDLDDNVCNPGYDDVRANLDSAPNDVPRVTVSGPVNSAFDMERKNDFEAWQCMGTWIGRWRAPRSRPNRPPSGGLYRFSLLGGIRDLSNDHPRSDDSPDLDLAGYDAKVALIAFRISPDEISVISGSTNVTFSLAAGSYAPAGVSWNLDPAGIQDGAVKMLESNDSLMIGAGEVETNYLITAISLDVPNCTATARLQVGCDCRPGERVDVTLQEGVDPFNQPFYAWSVNNDFFPELINRVFDVLDLFGVDACRGRIGKYPTFYAKRYIDECCPDRVPDCKGRYSYESTRHHKSQQFECEGERNILEYLPSSVGDDFFAAVRDYVEDMLPLAPESVIDEIVGWIRGKIEERLPTSRGTLAFRDLTNDQTTHEYEECRNCPPTVPKCWTGVTRTRLHGLGELLLPRQDIPDASNSLPMIGMQVAGVASATKQGYRIGLENTVIDQSQSAVSWRWKLPSMRTWGPRVPITSANPPTTTTRTRLCM